MLKCGTLKVILLIRIQELLKTMQTWLHYTYILKWVVDLMF